MKVCCTLQVLCAMLECDVVENNDLKMQMVTTLQSTMSGKRMYADLCERQIALRELVHSFHLLFLITLTHVNKKSRKFGPSEGHPLFVLIMENEYLLRHPLCIQ